MTVEAEPHREPSIVAAATSSKITPRTNVLGAHQSNLTVRAGGRLSSKGRRAAAAASAATAAAGVAAGSASAKARSERTVIVRRAWRAGPWTIAAVSAVAVGALALLVEGMVHAGRRPLLPAWLVVGMLVLALAALAALTSKSARAYGIFAWNCFIKPFLKRKPNGITSDAHQKRLEAFYEGQAEVYDVTRKRLLRGRTTMLKVASAQLKQVYSCSYTPSSFAFAGGYRAGRPGVNVNDPAALPSPPMSPSLVAGGPGQAQYAWIDIGGGTGENIQKMHAYYPIHNFARVYCVDITPSLCAIAQERFERLGWNNVVVVCMDASTFQIPESDGPLELALITMSYSLSMMETYYPVLDHLESLLAPTGIIGVADFYVSSKRAADPTSQMSWVMRWFWSMWFDLDNIYLHPSRREYLSHKFKTIKSLSCRNHFVKPFVKIPYYIWLGAKKTALEPFALDAPEPVAPEALTLPKDLDDSDREDEEAEEEALDARAIAEEEAEEQAVAARVLAAATQTVAASTGPSNKVQAVPDVHGQSYRWRQPFDASLIPRFRTFIYAFTWEDPRVDLAFLDLKPADHMMVITSGGCNALEYAIQVGPKAIHCVDLNPAQNNMLELKLAGIAALEYEEFWALFGLGQNGNFASVLDTKLSPYLSPHAHSFWKENAKFRHLYKMGCSGLAIRVFSFVVKLRGLTSAVERMCHCDTITEQVSVWRNEIRPHFLSTWLIRLLNNDRFLWGALGVPPAQIQMLIEEGSVYEYCVNTLDPVVENSLLKTDNYFYYLPLMMRYSRACCPSYLSSEGFATLQREPERLDAIQIHTDMLVNVLEAKVADGELNKIILMDHLDWFSEEDALTEITAVHHKLAVGGQAFWRSAGKHPWYNALFAAVGFAVTPCQIRENGMYIDRVNMYASFWRGVKLAPEDEGSEEGEEAMKIEVGPSATSS